MQKYTAGLRASLPLLFSAALLTAPAYGGMMEHMHDHMQQHMGGGMMGTQSEGKAGGPLTMEAEQNGVAVKVAYNNPGAREAPEFAVKLDTHSVDLDAYRLEEMTILRDEKGQEHAAELVSTSGSGHHREAVLRFNGVDLSGARSVEVIIKRLADVEARAFRFDLGKGKKETGGSKHQH